MSYPTLAYTDSFDLGTDEIIIAKCIGSESPGNGKIPNRISISAVSVCPETTTDEYYVKGIDASSDWCKYSGEFELEGLSESSYQIMRIKGVSGTITINLVVKGSGAKE